MHLLWDLEEDNVWSRSLLKLNYLNSPSVSVPLSHTCCSCSAVWQSVCAWTFRVWECGDSSTPNTYRSPGELYTHLLFIVLKNILFIISNKINAMLLILMLLKFNTNWKILKLTLPFSFLFPVCCWIIYWSPGMSCHQRYNSCHERFLNQTHLNHAKLGLMQQRGVSKKGVNSPYVLFYMTVVLCFPTTAAQEPWRNNPVFQSDQWRDERHRWI